MIKVRKQRTYNQNLVKFETKILKLNKENKKDDGGGHGEEKEENVNY